MGAKNTLTSMRKRPSGGGVGGGLVEVGVGWLGGGVEVLAGEVSGGSEFGSCHNPVTLKVQFRLILGFASKLIVL